MTGALPTNPSTLLSHTMQHFEALRSLLAQTLKVSADRITPDTVASDLPAWDSLAHVNLMMSLEQAFDIMLDVEEFPELTSVRAILARLDPGQ
jgi:acyl carrier protein